MPALTETQKNQPNPWKRDRWNFTEQLQIIQNDPEAVPFLKTEAELYNANLPPPPPPPIRANADQPAPSMTRKVRASLGNRHA